MKRKASCDNQDAMNRGPWSAEEDRILINYVQVHGEGKWRELSKRAGLKRRGKSCRLRWLNYLKPDVKRGNISSDEEDLIIRLHSLLGNRWSLIAGRLPGRTDNEIKNYWNTYLRKKIEQEHNHNKFSSQNNNNIPIKLGIDHTKSSHPMTIKSMRCSEIMMPTQTINDSVNAMNFITTSWDQNPFASIPQDDHDHYSAGFLKHFDISDLLMPYEDCHFNRYACVEIPEYFGDEAYRANDATSETWYENWKIGDYFPLEYDVGFSLF